MCKDAKAPSDFSAIYGACISQPDDSSSGDRRAKMSHMTHDKMNRIYDIILVY